MADSIALALDPDVTTCLAAHLNAAMSRNPAARAAYERLYGVQWCALGCGCEIADDASTTAATVR